MEEIDMDLIMSLIWMFGLSILWSILLILIGAISGYGNVVVVGTLMAIGSVFCLFVSGFAYVCFLMFSPQPILFLMAVVLTIIGIVLDRWYSIRRGRTKRG
jgi:ABC-type microcin C transport system permease subunit YejE